MARGFSGTGEFTALLNAEQRMLAERLAEIEREDADRCSMCGGEDCICCEIYQDRMRWQYAELMRQDEERRKEHPCCENCRYFYTEAGADLCKYWDAPEEDVRNSKCWKWC